MPAAAALLQLSACGVGAYGGTMMAAPGSMSNFYYKKSETSKSTKRAWRLFGYAMLASATRDAIASKEPNKFNLMAAGTSWGLFPIMIASQSGGDDGIKPVLAIANAAVCLAMGGVLWSKALEGDKSNTV